MASLASCGTSIIVLINTLFGIIGLVFLVAGIMVKQFPTTVDTLMVIVKAKLKDMIPPEANINLDDFSVTKFIGGAATPFIIIGLVLLAIVVWAYCGTLCRSKWMLIIYAAIMSLLIVGEVVFIVLFITKRDLMDGVIKKPMKASLVGYYAGDTATDGASLGWNAVMGLLDCCGVDGYHDFEKTTSWNNTLIVGGQNFTLEAPIICCKTTTTTSPMCSAVQIGNAAKPASTYKDNGCYDALWDMIASHKSIVIGILAGLGVFQAILLIFVIVIIKSLSKKDKTVHPE